MIVSANDELVKMYLEEELNIMKSLKVVEFIKIKNLINIKKNNQKISEIIN